MSNPVELKLSFLFKVGVCKRLLKEVKSYEEEVLRNEARVQKMRDDGKDIYDIRKQVYLFRHSYTAIWEVNIKEEVLQESYMMIPDSKRRYDEAIAKLRSDLVGIKAVFLYIINLIQPCRKIFRME